jgi:hypothetical protein
MLSDILREPLNKPHESELRKELGNVLAEEAIKYRLQMPLLRIKALITFVVFLSSVSECFERAAALRLLYLVTCSGNWARMSVFIKACLSELG